MGWKLEVVMVPVADIDRAKYFYHEQIGFVVDHDTHISDEVRLVQLTPPGSVCSIVVSKGMVVDMQPGSLKGLQLVVSDVDAAHAQLIEQGAAVSPVSHFEGADLKEGRSGDWNSFIFFDDPDGNSWTVQEWPKRD